MRTPIAAGNWKMNFGPYQAGIFTSQIRSGIAVVSGVETVLFPPFISLSAVHAAIDGTSIQLGAQNCSSHVEGAYTGEISVAMIAELCGWVILGHSERRRNFGETDAMVRHKTQLALAAGLLPIVCVGENLDDHVADNAARVITTQLRNSLANLPTAHIGKVVVAYEPVWAIGSGKPDTLQDVAAVLQTIRHLVAEMYGTAVAEALRILYGGSVTKENITPFMASPHIDGALVGGASLQPEFVAIAKAIAAARSI